MTDRRETPLFTQAIEALEAGDSNGAEILFRKTIEALGPAHNQSHLSFKSLISIATEEGDYTKALNISLDLLDAQIKHLGIRHSDCTRTINNVYTLCNTLGNHELAEEIMNMAREAESAVVAKSMNKLREEEDLEGEEPEKGVKTSFFDSYDSAKEWYDSLGDALLEMVSLVFVILVAATVLGGVAALSFLVPSYQDQEKPDFSHEYTSAEHAITMSFEEETTQKAKFNLVRKQFLIPLRLYGNTWGDFGDLILSPLDVKEYWLKNTAGSFVSASGQMLYGSESAEMEILSIMEKTLSKANEAYKDLRTYPDTLSRAGTRNEEDSREEGIEKRHGEERESDDSAGEESDRKKQSSEDPEKEASPRSIDFDDEGDDFGDGDGSDEEMLIEYINPFTRRKDYPIVTTVQLPNEQFKDRKQFYAHLKAGGKVKGAPASYPGCINCVHYKSETANSFSDDFVVRGYDRFGMPFRGGDGKIILLYSERGAIMEEPPPQTNNIKDCDQVSIWMSPTGPPLFILANRQLIFYMGIGIVMLFFGVVFKAPKTRVVAKSIGTICIGIGILSLII